MPEEWKSSIKRQFKVFGFHFAKDEKFAYEDKDSGDDDDCYHDHA